MVAESDKENGVEERREKGGGNKADSVVYFSFVYILLYFFCFWLKGLSLLPRQPGFIYTLAKYLDS